MTTEAMTHIEDFATKSLANENTIWRRWWAWEARDGLGEKVSLPPEWDRAPTLEEIEAVIFSWEDWEHGGGLLCAADDSSVYLMPRDIKGAPWVGDSFPDELLHKLASKDPDFVYIQHLALHSR
jgi:hypothetical protein